MKDSSFREPIRVLYVIFGLGMGGAEMVLLELINGLNRAEVEPIVLSLSPPAALSERFAAAKIEVHYLALAKIGQAPLTLWRAVRAARKIDPDIIQGVMLYGDLTARLVGLALRKPRIISAVHNTVVGKPHYLPLMRYTDSLTDAVIAVSAAVANHHVSLGTVQRAKTTVIANGIDARRFGRPAESELIALRERFGIESGQRVLLCVSRLEPQKNHALLLRTFAKLTLRLPNICLLLAGDGRLQNELRNQATILGISRQVIFAGRVDPVAPLFHLADVFVLASSREGLPMVVLEAMAAGVVVVCTSVGGIPEVITHGVNGLLTPSNDEVELESALHRVLECSETELQSLVTHARADVEARFGTAQMVSRTTHLYREVLRRVS